MDEHVLVLTISVEKKAQYF